VVIDPVDGAGRNPTALSAAAEPAGFTSRTLVVGAGLGERCAPPAVNHRHFAAAAPPGSTHVVIDSMGHGDMLDDGAARASRRLCGGSDDPGHERRTLAELISGFVEQP
jgi:pimeloyl-ACP methyl ester carboxylesterase